MCKEMSSTRAPTIVFRFRSCSFSVVCKPDGTPRTLPFGPKADKELLKDVTAEVSSGNVLTILGPSGAGKTTLLNMLKLAPTSGTATGTVTLNDQPFSEALYRKYCASVEQEAALTSA